MWKSSTTYQILSNLPGIRLVAQIPYNSIKHKTQACVLFCLTLFKILENKISQSKYVNTHKDHHIIVVG